MNIGQSAVAFAILAVMLVLVLLLAAFPALDLGVSELFYAPGIGFRIDGVWYERIVYRSVPYMLVCVSLGLFAAWIYGRRSGRGVLGPVTGRELAFLVFLLGLGPGLVVNEGMKENWGRSRPVDLIQFGGDKQFSRALVLSDQGGKSFPSGHAAAAFYLVAVAFMIARRRRLWMGLAFAYGLLVGGMRVASGGHFLSDVLTSALVVWLLVVVLYQLFFGRYSAWSKRRA